MLSILDIPTKPKPSPTAVEISEDLRGALNDDKRFRDKMAELASSKPVTKAILADVYKLLYRRQGGLRSSASREEVLQLITDERSVLRRHGTLSALLRD
jgi:hypothetical protein